MIDSKLKLELEKESKFNENKVSKINRKVENSLNAQQFRWKIIVRSADKQIKNAQAQPINIAD